VSVAERCDHHQLTCGQCVNLVGDLVLISSLAPFHLQVVKVAAVSLLALYKEKKDKPRS
jgi:hypothetical protein